MPGQEEIPSCDGRPSNNCYTRWNKISPAGELPSIDKGTKVRSRPDPGINYSRMNLRAFPDKQNLHNQLATPWPNKIQSPWRELFPQQRNKGVFPHVADVDYLWKMFTRPETAVTQRNEVFFANMVDEKQKKKKKEKKREKNKTSKTSMWITDVHGAK